MARFKPMELISEMRGKFSGKSEYYAAEKYGTQYTGKIGEISVPATEKQTAARQRFATAHANANGLSTEEKAAYAEAFKQNKKRGTSPLFLFWILMILWIQCATVTKSGRYYDTYHFIYTIA